MVATKRLRLAMETDEERKSRLEKMVATTQLHLEMRNLKQTELQRPGREKQRLDTLKRLKQGDENELE